MTRENSITLVSAFKSTGYTLRVCDSNDSDKVEFWIYDGSQHVASMAISRHDTRLLIDFLDSLVWSREAAPKPAEPANLAVLYSTPSGWAFRQVESKKEATTFAAEVKNERAGRKVRLVNMLADYEIADPVYEWKDI